MIDTSAWTKFKVSDIFITEKHGSGLQVPTGAMMSKKDLMDGDIPRVTVSNYNNGITGYYADSNGKNYRTYQNFISVSFLGTVFYQPDKVSLDMKVHCLKPLDYELNVYSAGYIVSIIRKAISNFVYSDQLSSTVLAELEFALPATSDGQPDWDCMESYMKSIMGEAEKSIEKLKRASCDAKHLIDVSGWGEFRVGDLFDVHPTNAYKITNAKLISDDGANPIVVNSGFNNGIGGFTNLDCTEKAGVITFTDTAAKSSESFFYQEQDFVGYPHVQGMYCKVHSLSVNEGKFITTVLRSAVGNYDFIVKMVRTDIMNLIIRLPIDNNGKPDWDYMENYMRNIMDETEQVLTELNFH